MKSPDSTRKRRAALILLPFLVYFQSFELGGILEILASMNSGNYNGHLILLTASLVMILLPFFIVPALGNLFDRYSRVALERGEDEAE